MDANCSLQEITAKGDDCPLIDMNLAEEFLHSKRGEASVWHIVNRLHDLGIHSIPTLIVNGGSACISGAANCDEVFHVLKSELKNVTSFSAPLFRVNILE